MTIGFIILRHVNSEQTNLYWNHCYECIRKFYPENMIMIIDDNSNSIYLKDLVPLYKTMIIYSEYHGRGELLPYYYYLKYKFCEKVVMLHDSMFIQKYLDDIDGVDTYQFLWEFNDHEWDDNDRIISIINHYHNDELIYLYNHNNLWNGCFGGMSIITHDYLSKINEEFDISLLLNHIHNRKERTLFERIIACILKFNHPYNNESLLGDIIYSSTLNLTYDNYSRGEYPNDLAIIKVFTGR